MSSTAVRRGLALATLVSVLGIGADASATDDDEACERPLSEGTTWLTVGSGLRPGGDGPAPFAELGGGTQLTFGASDSGDLRLGGFAQFGTGHFDTSWVGGGPMLQLTGAPHDFDLFQFRGDGELSVRFLTAFLLGNADFGVPGGGVALGGTITWGYRAPFDLRHSYPCGEGACDGDRCREGSRYFTGARIYTTVMRAVNGEAGWQVTAGIEFEPVGSVRYLFGLY